MPLATVARRAYHPLRMPGPREPKGERSTQLAQDVTDARLKLGLTQQALADRLGVSLTTVQNWEAGSTAPRGVLARAVRRFLAQAAEEK